MSTCFEHTKKLRFEKKIKQIKYVNSFLECTNLACEGRHMVRELDKTIQNGVTKTADWLINVMAKSVGRVHRVYWIPWIRNLWLHVIMKYFI